MPDEATARGWWELECSGWRRAVGSAVDSGRLAAAAVGLGSDDVDVDADDGGGDIGAAACVVHCRCR